MAEGSQFGIDGGKFGETRDLCNYGRGWDVEPADEVNAVYAIILEKYN